MPRQQMTLQPIRRLPRRHDAFMLPRPVAGEPGRFVVDATWGRIMPIELEPGVRTVGEVEVIAHIELGLPLVDTRLPKYVAAGTIPTARSVPHTETADRLDDFDTCVETILFCNGPQCAATPDAIRTLLAAGYPPEGSPLLPRRHPRLGHARPSARAPVHRLCGCARARRAGQDVGSG